MSLTTRGDRRSLVEQLMTGVDNDVANLILENDSVGVLDTSAAEDPGVAARIRPERSLFTAIAQTHQPMLAELEHVPGAADAIQKLVVSIWQYAFRSEIGFSDIAIRDTRTEREESEIHYTIARTGDTKVFLRPITGVPLPEFVDKRSQQLEAVWLETAGIADAAFATFAALKVFALRYGLPINQVGMRDGKFRPTAIGGELRFSCYWSPPKR